jgi:K+-transporting ATPase ATPase C chain
MDTRFLGQLRPAALALLSLTAVTGILYPIAVTVVAQIAFPRQANGSLIVRPDSRGERAIGSRLVGQPFDDPGYFWGRPSATAPPCNAASSSGSNLGPTNPALLDAVKARIAALHAGDPSERRPVPVDLVTASGSGLDPDISPASAFFQVRRVAKTRRVSPAVLEDLVQRHVEPRQLGILGEPRVNVLLLNLDLDTVAPR